MKIYIQNNITKMKLSNLKHYSTKESVYNMIYSSTGVWKIESNNIYKCCNENYHSTEIVQYGAFTFLLDKTEYIQEKITSQLPVKYINVEMKRTEYFFSLKSIVRLVIEKSTNTDNVPIQLYFLTDGNLEDHFVKEAIDEFLTLL
jgi:hypothetical protein